MYIPIWIIVIAVVVYFFWARKKKQGSISKNTDNKFVGRYQQVCIVKKFLGGEIPDLELQIAINKDNSEQEEIIKKLEEVEKYISSDMFTHRLDVESVNKDMRDLIGEGYKNCVLTNDTFLENRCYKIFDDTNKYSENSLKKEEKSKSDQFADLADRIRSLFVLEGLVNHISLGGLLRDSSDEQKAWIIMNSLLYSNELAKTASSLLPPEPAKKEASELKSFADKLLSKKKISSNDLRKIEDEIKEGLLLGKENYKGKV